MAKVLPTSNDTHIDFFARLIIFPRHLPSIDAGSVSDALVPALVGQDTGSRYPKRSQSTTLKLMNTNQKW